MATVGLLSLRVLVAHKFWHTTGGVEVAVARHVRFLESRGHEVIPFGMSHPANEVNEASGVPFPSQVEGDANNIGARVRFLRRMLHGRESAKGLTALVNATRPDLIHLFSTYHHLGPDMLRVLERLKTPVVMSAHDYKISCATYQLYDRRRNALCTHCIDYPDRAVMAPITVGCTDDWRSAAALSLETLVTRGRRLYPRAVDQLTVLNETAARGALSAGFPQERVTIVPNYRPVNTAPVVPEFLNARGVPRLGFVGRLVREKRPARLLDVAARLGNTDVIFVGDGPMASDLRSLASQLGVSVTVTGWVSAERARNVTAGFDALLFLPVWAEGDPLAIHDAMSASVPVVGTHVPGVSDLLGGGRGFLVSEESLDEALVPAVRSALGDEGRVAAATAKGWVEYERSEAAYSRLMSGVYGAVGVRW